VLYRVSEHEALEPIRDVKLVGRPVALAAADDRFYVLQHPPGDARHVEPGWWETIDFGGNRLGSRFVTGFYPDDLVLSADGKHALVLTSGRAEGGPHRPAPALDVIELGGNGDAPRVAGRLTFDRPKDDPARLTLAASGRCAAVTLWGSNEVAAVDLNDLSRPALISRSPLPELEVPYPSHSGGDSILMPVDSRSEAVWAEYATADGATAATFVACTLPHESGVRLYHASTGRALGELTLHGPLNLGRIRPTGLAYNADRGLLALANRTGGVHLIAIRPKLDVAVPSTGLASAGPPSERR
jgi:glycerol-3-phosphate acyltransferase PlsY